MAKVLGGAGDEGCGGYALGRFVSVAALGGGRETSGRGERGGPAGPALGMHFLLFLRRQTSLCCITPAFGLLFLLAAIGVRKLGQQGASEA